MFPFKTLLCFEVVSGKCALIGLTGLFLDLRRGDQVFQQCALHWNPSVKKAKSSVGLPAESFLLHLMWLTSAAQDNYQLYVSVLSLNDGQVYASRLNCRLIINLLV